MTKPLQVKMDEQELKQLKIRAAEQGTDMSDIVRGLITKYLKKAAK